MPEKPLKGYLPEDTGFQNLKNRILSTTLCPIYVNTKYDIRYKNRKTREIQERIDKRKSV